MRAFLTKAELHIANQKGERIEAGPRTGYAGEAVEYSPRKDSVNNHPDCYPWHVIGRPDYDRLRNSEVVVVESAAS
ncbi:hypothetical protein ACFVSQ_10195 [Streptomyces niveus]|uniref:hypothetical protein n=1 Tax=Streptomyces niveus TaxID=193462 RepID=UPI0036ED4BF8